MFENLFENPLALIGLALIPALIILYLLKPKPKDYEFPTLMFITDIEKREWLRSFLKRLIKDPVLLIQILIIGFLVFAVANPFYTTEAEAFSGNIILIIDSSASMQSIDLEPDRFSFAISEAAEIIKKSGSNKVTIITSSDVWSVLLMEGKSEDALKTLNNLKAGDSQTNIAYSMLSAKDVVNADPGEKKVMYVISDFAGEDVLENVLESKSKLESEGVVVLLKRIGEDERNIGIVDAESYRTTESKCLVNIGIMNYNERSEFVEVTVDDKKINENKININPYSKETFSKEINCGNGEKIEIKIKPASREDDLLEADNVFSFTAPEFKRILFISDDDELRNTFDTIHNLELTDGHGTDNFSGFDVVVTDKNFNEDKISGYLKEGGSFIFIAPDAFYKWEYDELKEVLPVEIEMDEAKAKLVVKNTKININPGSEEFKNIDLENFDRYFLEVKRYYSAKSRNSTVLLRADDGNVLAAKNNGIYYIGFNSKATNIDEIPTEISYVILWYGIIRSTKKTTEVDCICSERESEIMPGNLSSYETYAGLETMKAQNKNYIFNYLLILGIVLAMIEVYYLKTRGQI